VARARRPAPGLNRHLLARRDPEPATASCPRCRGQPAAGQRHPGRRPAPPAGTTRAVRTRAGSLHGRRCPSASWPARSRGLRAAAQDSTRRAPHQYTAPGAARGEDHPVAHAHACGHGFRHLGGLRSASTNPDPLVWPSGVARSGRTKPGQSPPRHVAGRSGTTPAAESRTEGLGPPPWLRVPGPPPGSRRCRPSRIAAPHARNLPTGLRAVPTAGGAGPAPVGRVLRADRSRPPTTGRGQAGAGPEPCPPDRAGATGPVRPRATGDPHWWTGAGRRCWSGAGLAVAWSPLGAAGPGPAGIQGERGSPGTRKP
jgi:hypothetical protein